MSDADILMLAAKAAGLRVEEHKGAMALVHCDGDECWRTGDYWNPLDDDGDALRLALACGLRVRECEAEWWPSESLDAQRIYEPSGDDPYAATRRAIVRAAAEIGWSQQ